MTKEEALQIITDTCKICDDKLREACAFFIPELKKSEESEDVKISREIIESIKGNMSVIHKDKCIAWLEKKGEQKPAWSEEDEIGLGNALWCCKQAASIAKDENDMGNAWFAEEWLKSLKSQNKLKLTPSQLSALEEASNDYVLSCDELARLSELYEQLKKL